VSFVTPEFYPYHVLTGSHSPQLQGAQVFGGIAGIIGEARDVEDPGREFAINPQH
jgi:hypothetical protein